MDGIDPASPRMVETHWNPRNNGRNHRFQLVQDFFHPPSVAQHFKPPPTAPPRRRKRQRCLQPWHVAAERRGALPLRAPGLRAERCRGRQPGKSDPRAAGVEGGHHAAGRGMDISRGRPCKLGAIFQQRWSLEVDAIQNSLHRCLKIWVKIPVPW